jgi:inosose dehydratase
MTKYLIGCGQITWRGEPEDEILTDIARAGYDGAPPKLKPDAQASDVIRRYEQHGLRPAPPYFGASFWKAEEEASILGRARDAAKFTRDIGCTELYVAAGGGGYQAPSGASRAKVAGNVSADDAMSGEEFDQFARVLSELGRITLEEGVRSCFHNHVGTVIETAEELDQLFACVDSDAVFLGLDTGHLAWAGTDTVAVCRRYADRIKTLHLKDIDDRVRLQGVEATWDYETFTKHGIFAELGEGSVDFPEIISILNDAGFEGWLIVETDVTQKPTALESATISREYLRGIGL